MKKIVFEDLPSQNTPINANNLNKMQDNIETEINEIKDYSTEEQIIGKWIDGKPLYRKVGYVGNTAISENETTVRYCELPADAKPVDVNAVVYTETSGYALFVNSSYSENGFKIRYMNDIHSIQVIATPDVALEKSFSAYVIMEYIKTTD